jgi:HTH-type transcriptional regulator / antitoxin HigA
MTITTDAGHQAALRAFELLANDEQGNLAQLVVLRDAIHDYELAQGHAPGPPTSAAGQREVEEFRRRLQQRENGK